MTPKSAAENPVPLFIARSNTSTESNKTGSWRFFHPKYDEKTAPCSTACPAGEDIGRIEMLVGREAYQEAWETIVAENPFPAVCGRVCFHPCEDGCNRLKLDDSIAVHHLERFVGDMAISKAMKFSLPTRPPNGRKVAIAGAGPAGLAAAFFLTRLGYACDVFEAASEPGGILRWGIPAYRLPGQILQNEIRRIERYGVKIHCGTAVTRGLLNKIQREFDAIFIGCGLAQPIRLHVPGAEMARDGLEFLYQLRNQQNMTLQGTAAVIGGGNTAVDVARSLVRTGSAPILVYRRRRKDMPGFAPEVEMALTEGVILKELLAPIRIAKDHTDPSAKYPGLILTLQKMKVSGSEISGRARVIPDDDRTETLRVDTVFTAIGADADPSWHDAPALDHNIIELSHCKFIDQDLPIVFGGDLTNRTRSVSDAIASGKQAALALDTYFHNGWQAVVKRLEGCRVGIGSALSMAVYLGEARQDRNTHVVSNDEINIDYFRPAPRKHPARLSVAQRTQSFAEIESTYSSNAALQEAERCFNCGVCNACDYCRLYCPEIAVMVADARRWINLDYCKGCGVCVTECPRNAMVMEEEKNEAGFGRQPRGI